MKQKEIEKMIELLKDNPDWLNGDTHNCDVTLNENHEYPCKGCPICNKKNPQKRIYTRGTFYCGDSFLVKLRRAKEEDRLEILTAVLM